MTRTHDHAPLTHTERLAVDIVEGLIEDLSLTTWAEMYPEAFKDLMDYKDEMNQAAHTKIAGKNLEQFNAVYLLTMRLSPESAIWTKWQSFHSERGVQDWVTEQIKLCPTGTIITFGTSGLNTIGSVKKETMLRLSLNDEERP